MKALLLLPVLPLLASCSAVSPHGAVLNGLDAEEVEITGNKNTGEFRFFARGLNHSKAGETVATTISDLAKIKGYTKFATETVGEVGSVASDAF